MKYAFIECQRRQHSVRTLCNALRVSPSGYYAARSRPPSAREERQSSLATNALAMAISRRGVPELVHSDQGSTYATSIYLDLIRKHGIRQSMSRKGNCWDNAPMESFFHSLKTELVMHCDYKTRDQARASLFDYMEVFYNRQRRHSTINYVAPLAFEESTSD